MGGRREQGSPVSQTVVLPRDSSPALEGSGAVGGSARIELEYTVPFFEGEEEFQRSELGGCENGGRGARQEVPDVEF